MNVDVLMLCLDARFSVQYCASLHLYC